MFPHSVIDYEVHLLRHREDLSAARCQHPVTDTLRQLGTVLARALAHVGASACNSREGLVSKEQQLAWWGVSWASDPTDDAQLAQELEASRRRRHAGTSGVPPAQPVVASVDGKLRVALIQSLLVRAWRASSSVSAGEG
jgi:hypothetical protein